MVLAISVLRERVAPVFDVSRNFLLIKGDENTAYTREYFSLKECNYSMSADILADNSVDVLICGAISKGFFCRLKRRNIKVYSFVSGDIESVLEEWQEGNLEEKIFSMPGCRRRRMGGGAFKGHL